MRPLSACIAVVCQIGTAGNQPANAKLVGVQDTLGSASDKADHHASKASKEGQSYLDSAKDQANQLFGQTQVQPQQVAS